jgi:hypothetical protein
MSVDVKHCSQRTVKFLNVRRLRGDVARRAKPRKLA